MLSKYYAYLPTGIILKIKMFNIELRIGWFLIFIIIPVDNYV